MNNPEIDVFLETMCEQNRKVYIYGAKKTAIRIFEILRELGLAHLFGGYVVSERDDNPMCIDQYPVWVLRELNNAEGMLLIPHKAIYREQILKMLGELGYNHYYFVDKILEVFRNTNRNTYMYAEYGMESYRGKSKEQKDRDTDFCNIIREMLKEGNPDFGAMKPYQSLEKIGLVGKRSTAYRIDCYGLREYMNSSAVCLDIGCNTGFFDISLADGFARADCIEYDETLAKIAKMTCEYLNISNIRVINDDFNAWFENNKLNRYQIIFSFAIHHWLGLSAVEYSERLDVLAASGCVITIESHEDPEEDTMYREIINNLNEKGFTKVREDEIEDVLDGRRFFAILKKE